MVDADIQGNIDGKGDKGEESGEERGERGDSVRDDEYHNDVIEGEEPTV